MLTHALSARHTIPSPQSSGSHLRQASTSLGGLVGPTLVLPSSSPTLTLPCPFPHFALLFLPALIALDVNTWWVICFLSSTSALEGSGIADYDLTQELAQSKYSINICELMNNKWVLRKCHHLGSPNPHQSLALSELQSSPHFHPLSHSTHTYWAPIVCPVLGWTNEYQMCGLTKHLRSKKDPTTVTHSNMDESQKQYAK